MNKNTIRKQIRTQRKELDSLSVALFSTAIQNNLLNLIGTLGAVNNIFIYNSFDNEVDTSKLINIFLSNNKSVYIPKIINIETSKMVACKLPSATHLTSGHYNIKEPNESCTELSESFDIAIIPGIAFSKDGHRIGFGKGYYDLFLNNNKCIKIGLGYSFQIVENIKNDVHDIAMNYVITEKDIHKCT